MSRSAVIFMCAVLIVASGWRSSQATPAPTLSIDFAEAKKVAFKYATLIHTRFDMGNPKRNPFFYISANMPSWGFDIIKLKIAHKMVQDKGNKTFLMIFGGSSVTAGHDNWYNQSYPFVAERRLAPVLAAVGVELVVRNIAMGSNNCLPYDYCYNAQGGEGADFLSWEQSFNCGKANGVYEMMARIAWWNGGVVYYMASGGFAPTGCGPSNVSGSAVELQESSSFSRIFLLSPFFSPLVNLLLLPFASRRTRCRGSWSTGHPSWPT